MTPLSAMRAAASSDVTPGDRASGTARILAHAGLGPGELLALLRAYETVVLMRPMEVGNREFLEQLLLSCRRLTDAIAASPWPPGVNVADLGRRVKSQAPETAAEKARDVLAAADGLLRKVTYRRTAPLRLRGILPPIANRYDSVVVVFGPGIGLGDEVTFAPFMRRLVGALGAAATTVFTLYPNVWRHLLPDVREVHYRGRPLRPFIEMEVGAQRLGSSGRQLVVIVDFEFFDVISNVVRRRANRDVVEVSLGKIMAWTAVGDSPWIRWDHFTGAAVKNNYWILASIADALFPDSSGAVWEPVTDRSGSVGRGSTILLNPLSSKPLPYTADMWRRWLRPLIRERGTPLRVLLFPGLHDLARRYVDEIRRALNDAGRIHAELIATPRGGPLTPVNAIPALLDTLDGVSLCITMDTFSAHLVPLFGVPTVVAAYADNYEFWVPSPWTFYLRLDRLDRDLPPLVRTLLKQPSNDVTERCAAIVAATERVASAAVRPASAVGVSTTVQQLLEATNGDLPFRREGMRWRATWSRLATATSEEPVDQQLLAPYLARWRDSGFYKVARTVAAAGERTTSRESA